MRELDQNPRSAITCGALARGGWALALLSVAACAPTPIDAPDASGDLDASHPDGGLDATVEAPLRVLFVGNSYTYYNDLPGTVRAIVNATTAGGAEVEAVTADGARLADHWESTGARARVESGDFDAVVLQGQSLEAIVSSADFQDHAARFAAALAGAGARGVWFATWGRRDVAVTDPDQIWRALEEQYATAAAHNGDAVARVGAAWEIALLEMPEVELFAADRSHPSPAGTLLASCVIARALTGVDPRLPEPTPLGIARDVAERLCAIAARGVPCDPQQSLCDDACVPWDASHCGGCGVACAGELPCLRGVCGCDVGQIACDERCVSLGSAVHCSGCDDRCGLGEECSDGACACPTTAALDVSDRFAELTALEPECATPDSAGSEACNAAAHRYCEGTGCFASGFLPAGDAPWPAATMCVQGVVRDTSFTALSALEPGCDGVAARAGQACATAAHRYCVGEGASSGFGPVASEGDAARVTCISSGEVVRVSDAELDMHASRCVPDAGTCSSAAWSFCVARGHTAGFGPVEIAGAERDVVCVPPREGGLD